MIKAVIFDFGGVLCDVTGKNICEAVCSLVGMDYKKASKPFAEHMKPFSKGQINENEFWKRILSDMGLNGKPGKYKNILYQAFSGIAKDKRSTIEIARNLRKSGYITALLSNVEPFAMKYNKEHGRYSHFWPVVLSAETGFAKPETEIYEFMLKKLELPPESCVFIDDKEVNLPPAKKLGMKTIHFTSPPKLKGELRKLGIKVE